MKRFARMRSERSASHPGSGRAQCRAGSIEGDGIRYGLITQAFTPRTINTANMIVITQSTTTRRLCDMFGKSLSTGPRTRLGDGRCELAPDQRDRVEIPVREVLQHHALVSDVF